jgi:hypothetical protein
MMDALNGQEHRGELGVQNVLIGVFPYGLETASGGSK